MDPARRYHTSFQWRSLTRRPGSFLFAFDVASQLRFALVKFLLARGFLFAQCALPVGEFCFHSFAFLLERVERAPRRIEFAAIRLAFWFGRRGLGFVRGLMPLSTDFRQCRLLNKSIR